MGKVVELQPSRGAEAKPRRRARRSRTALVLGGGGLTGGVYEIGALRALDLLSVNRTVNQYDIYVGTSAGAFVAAMAASGITPEEMMRVVNRQGPAPFRDVGVGTLLRPNLIEFARKGVELPLHALRLARSIAGNLGALSAMDVVVGLAEALPSGMYTGAGIERYIRAVLSDDGRRDDFRTLEAELYLAATDLDTCERIVFGRDGWDDVPISRAVHAATALPMIYKPVRVHERELVDGGIVSTTNIDIAIEAGARLVVVLNPLVPYVNDFSKRVGTVFGSRLRHVSDMGFPQIGYQAFKLLAHQRLHEMVRHWEERYPGIDIVLVEPEPNDELMFRTSMMTYTSRVEIARHGFESVTLKLAEDYELLRDVFERHGIKISAGRLRKVVKHFSAEKEKARAWRKILEQTTGTLLRQSGSR